VNPWISGILYGFGVTVKRKPVLSDRVSFMFLVLCFQNSLLISQKKKYFIVYIREIPLNFLRFQNKIYPDEGTL